MYKPETCTTWSECILENVYIYIYTYNNNSGKKEHELERARAEILDGLDGGKKGRNDTITLLMEKSKSNTKINENIFKEENYNKSPATTYPDT